MRQGLLAPRTFTARLSSLAHRARRSTPGAVLVCLALIVIALAGCNLPFSTASTSVARPTATPIPPLATNKGGVATQELAAISPGVTQCSKVSGFESAPAASAGSGFTDVPFPPQSVAVSAAAQGNVYTFALVSACTSSGGAQSILAFYAQQMLAAGWKQSATYPYSGDPAHACGDTYCWRKADKSVRYVSLEQMTSTDVLTVFTLRLATAPTPTASLALRSAIGGARPGGTATASVSCQNGEQMVGGGFNISSSDHSYTVRSSYPSSAGTWSVTAVATGSSPLSLQAYVGCLQANYSLGIQIIQATFDTSAVAPQATLASCASGAVTGGGAQISGGAVLAESSPSDDGKSWSVAAVAGANGAKGTAYALCATRSVDLTPPTKRSFTIESGNDAQASLSCATGQWLSSGGYSNADPSADGKNVFGLDGPTADYSRWFLDGYNFDGASAHGATIWVTCVQPDPQF